MTLLTLIPDLGRKARLAGLLYLAIIVTGLGAEPGRRAPLIDLGDAGATATAILAAPGRFRLAISANLVMAHCDAGLAILLFVIFRTMAPGLALSEIVFRLIQTVPIGASLMALVTIWLVLTRATGLADAPALALVLLDLHAHGYDIGLVFFGVNSLIMGLPFWRSVLYAKAFGAGLRTRLADLFDRKRPAALRAGVVGRVRPSPWAGYLSLPRPHSVFVCWHSGCRAARLRDRDRSAPRRGNPVRLRAG